MKNTTFLCAILAALAVSAGARAADTKELKVKGTVRPAACTLTLGANGTADYGTITNAQLSASSPTKLSNKIIPYSVNCPNGAAQVALALTDNRKSSVVAGMANKVFNENDSAAFGLGVVNGKNLGIYTVAMDSTARAVLGGSTSTYDIYTTRSSNGGESWFLSQSMSPLPFRAGGLLSWGLATATPEPRSLTSVSGNLNVQAAIETLGNLPTGDNIPLDGSATLELKYM